MENVDNKLYRHKLIQEEFRSILKNESYPINPATEGVVILSAAPAVDPDTKQLTDKSPENKERISYGIEIIKKIVAHKANKPLDLVTPDDILQYGPPLILNGAEEQLEPMVQLCKDFQFPLEKMQQINCGKRKNANTKTQFEVMNSDDRFRTQGHLTFITSSYHIPRVARTAEKQFQHSPYDIVGVPKQEPYNVFRVVLGEVRRIIQYSKKGDIAQTIEK